MHREGFVALPSHATMKQLLIVLVPQSMLKRGMVLQKSILHFETTDNAPTFNHQESTAPLFTIQSDKAEVV